MSTRPTLYLGASRPLDGGRGAAPLRLPPHHLVTHACILGMTGSGKSGLVTVMAEEALRARVPVLMVDVKGDLPNLLLAFPTFDAAEVEPWIEPHPGDPRSVAEVAAAAAAERKESLGAWGIRERDLAAFRERTAMRVITPGSSAGEPL